MRLIGLNARLHAGKDTAFDTIDQEATATSLLALRRAFADPLKISGMRTLGLSGAGDDAERVLAIANKIKETGMVSVAWVDEALGVQALAVTGRQFWQYYGTEAHRADDLGSSFGPGFWVDNLLPVGTVPTSFPEIEREGVSEQRRPAFWDNFREDWAGYADIAVVTDVRFANEAERILELGGEVWYIDAEERLGPNPHAHISEQPLEAKYVTKVIDNNGTLAAFQQNILDALHS